jgi:hypothetical protein
LDPSPTAPQKIKNHDCRSYPFSDSAPMDAAKTKGRRQTGMRPFFNISTKFQL